MWTRRSSSTSRRSPQCVKCGMLYWATAVAWRRISQEKVVTFPGHTVLAANGTAPMPSQKLSKSMFGDLIVSDPRVLLGILGGFGEHCEISRRPHCVGDAGCLKYLQPAETLSPGRRGGTPCFHTYLASSAKEKTLPGDSGRGNSKVSSILSGGYMTSPCPLVLCKTHV